MRFDEEWASRGAHETDWNDGSHVDETYLNVVVALDQCDRVQRA